jgi:hypothetical protein
LSAAEHENRRTALSGGPESARFARPAWRGSRAVLSP